MKICLQFLVEPVDTGDEYGTMVGGVLKDTKAYSDESVVIIPYSGIYRMIRLLSNPEFEGCLDVYHNGVRLLRDNGEVVLYLTKEMV